MRVPEASVHEYCKLPGLVGEGGFSRKIAHVQPISDAGPGQELPHYALGRRSRGADPRHRLASTERRSFVSRKELAKFGHRTTENECYPVVDTAFGARSIRGIRSAGTTTVGQSAARRPSRRISAPTILHSDPISLGGKIPWIERRVTRRDETIPGWVETGPARAMVCKSPSFPSRIDFRRPAAATGAVEGMLPGLFRASQVQNAGEKNWK